jgi:hypothetical protein
MEKEDRYKYEGAYVRRTLKVARHLQRSQVR